MKTGRPEYYIPSPATVSRDVKKVFANARKRITKMLQEHEGTLSFATDAWASPNHKANKDSELEPSCGEWIIRFIWKRKRKKKVPSSGKSEK
jgi:hypothetical protein